MNVWLRKHTQKEPLSWMRKQLESAGAVKHYERLSADLSEEQRLAAAIIVVNQEIFNSAHGDTNRLLERNSVAIAEQIWTQTKLSNLVSVQPMLSPCSTAMFRVGRKNVTEEFLAKTKKMKAIPVGGFDGPAEEYANILAQELRVEIEREVITDLRNNAGTVNTGTDFIQTLWHLQSAVTVKATKYFEQETHPNWIVMGPELAESVGYDDSDFSLGLRQQTNKCTKSECLYGLKVFVDPLFPANQFLIGYKGGIAESGYQYMPYCALGATPVVLDPETFCPRAGILSRYGKRLVLWEDKRGSALYGRGTVIREQPVDVMVSQDTPH